MIRIALVVLLVVAIAVVSAMLWQHRRYLHVRRGVVQDHQAILHSAGTFHVLLFLETKPGTDVLDEVRALQHATEGSEATWIYAGKSVVPALTSSQMGKNDWSAIVLLQYSSREAFDRHAQSEQMRTALGRFAEVYRQGFRRSPVVNAMIPQVLLGMRAAQIVRGRPSYFPFVPAEDVTRLPEAGEIERRLLGERELGADAIVIVNLIKAGTAEERAANRRYGAPMLGAMAEGGYGPIHLGAAVRVEREHDFDDVVLVYYPGVQFFADLVRSTFYQAIYGDKQLGDSQANITVPILDRL